MAFTLAVTLIPFEQTKKVEAAVEEPSELKRVTVHDPSVFKDENGMYYVLGSHVASAESKDLMQWKQLSTDYQNVDDEPFYGDLSEQLKEPFAWAGYDDGDCSGGKYAVWAPDMIYNPYYEWEDGSKKGAYMLYFCTTSTWKRSCIVYMAAKDAEGPYEYVDTVIYSGFSQNGEPDGKSTRNTRWDNDYLNLKELVDLGAENGGIDGISERWFDSNGNWNQNYAPNAIDPTVFFDAEGDRMYMTYGSWSGGLFVLELDPTDGSVIYPGVDSIDPVSQNVTDRYFGTHIAGGNHQSGEAPYILYDEESDYYYLYETYGGLTAAGGYNMRLFRSKNVTGPYLDAAGNNAADSSKDNNSYGIKVMGNYDFYNQQGKRSAGHNSAMIDEDGSRYLVYHQRFLSNPQMEYHEVRVHEQFLNEDNWPVTAVYEYRDEEISNYDVSQVTGAYEFINHGTDSSGGMLVPQMVYLNTDGTVSGDVTGTWTKSDSGKGYDYVTVVIGDVTYKGVFYLQYHEADDPRQVMTFTAIGNNNTTIWGSRCEENDEIRADMARDRLDNIMPDSVGESFILPDSVMGAAISWSSDQPSVLSASGEVVRQKEETKVALTAAITYGKAVLTKVYEITVQEQPSLIYGYDFEEPAKDGTLTPMKGSGKTGRASLMGLASVVEDEERGRVLKLTNEAGAKGANYLKLPEDTLSTVTKTGYSVSMWTNIGPSSSEHSALFEADSSAEVPGYPMTRIGVNLIARINANGYSDVQGDLLTENGSRGQWQQVTYTVSPAGIRVYLNGKLAGEEVKDLAGCFDDTNAFSIQKAAHAAVGSGFIWNDEDVRDAMFDDVKIYSGMLTADEVLRAYKKDQGILMEQLVDVSEDDWFFDEVQYVYQNKIMTGLEEGVFGPYVNMSRAHFVLTLYRLEGMPEVEYHNNYPDVEEDTWYTKAAAWAAEAGVASGYTNGNFGPADIITREQMALMMYRYAQYKKMDTSCVEDYSGYQDADSVSAFAETAMKWAVGAEIIRGKQNATILEPQGNTSRAEGAMILSRFMQMK